MIDLEIRYPTDFDILPFTTNVSVAIGDNINALRDSILNMQEILGKDVNIGLFTPDPQSATVADRLNRIERGIAERNLVFREINVSDSLRVVLNQNNEPFVTLGQGLSTIVTPVTILGPLTILAPQVSDPKTIMQTPLVLDVTTFNEQMSASSLIKGKSNQLSPLLTIQDTNISPGEQDYALKVSGNMIVTGTLTAEFSIDHSKLLNINTTPTENTRGNVIHVTQGNYHTHRKGRYDSDNDRWFVSTDVNTADSGIISHKDLVGINTLPTQGPDFRPNPDIAYHVTNGDLHSHKDGDGAQVDHNDLKNISPKFSNHITGGDTHAHTANQDGGQISHQDLSDTETTGTEAIHVSGGDSHAHSLDDDGNPVGDGAQISHTSLSDTDPGSSNHVTGGDSHAHTSDGDGGVISHLDLDGIDGTLTHEEIDNKISQFRAARTGTATFTSTIFDELTVQHGLGTDQFNVAWSFSGENYAPPSDPADVGIIYITDKTSTSFKLNRVGGLPPGPATQATLTTTLGAANANLDYTARTAGVDGNSITIEYAVNSSITNDPTISSSGSQITVLFISATANAAINAIRLDPVANSLVRVELASGSNGSAALQNYGPINLADGYDSTGFQGLSLEWIAVSSG